jgi:DNA invertase Pin-like site-specific DNA recombinase
MFQMMGVFAEFERAMIVNRIHSGLARARAEGRRLGRPSALTPQVEERVRELLADRIGVVKIGRRLGIGTVRRIKDSQAARM